MHRRGEPPVGGFGLGGGAPPRGAQQCVVPVVVETPEEASAGATGRIEIVLGGDVRVVVDAAVHGPALARVIAVVAGR